MMRVDGTCILTSQPPAFFRNAFVGSFSCHPFFLPFLFALSFFLFIFADAFYINRTESTGIRTADFIVENKGIFKMYDLKSISGKASLENRLIESIGQTNHVLINVCTKYNPRLMATQIRSYFQFNPKAIEVLVYKGKKAIVVTRRIAENPLFLIQFQRKFAK